MRSRPKPRGQDQLPHGTFGRWSAVVLQAGRDLWANHALEWAAALSFYALLSILPLLLAAAAIASYVVEPAWAIDWLTMLAETTLPPNVVNTDLIVSGAIAHRGPVGIAGIMVWILGGRRILGCLITAMNVVSDVDEDRETTRRRVLVEVALLLGLGLLFLATLIAGPRLAPPGSWSASLVVVALLLAGFCVLYSVVPFGVRGKRAVVVGAGVATLLFMAARLLYRAFLDSTWASFDLIYGPLAVAAVLLLWGWYAGLVVLFGASLASHVKVMLEEGGSATEARRRHVARSAQ
jgi:membrane protein